MLSLTLLLTVQRATGSYPDGGFAVAAFALAAGTSAPARGRLVDRRGARRWLPTLAAGYASALVALDVVARMWPRPWALLLLAGASGLSAPPLFASARPLWLQAVEPELVRRGYALTSLLSDVGQVTGPALAGVLFIAAGWLAPLVCAALGLVAAGLSVSRGGVERARPAPMPRLLGSRGLMALLGVSIVLGGAFGTVQVAVPTVAERWHHGSLAGPLLASFALGSVLGALWFGGRRWHGAVLDRYLIAVFALGALLAPVGLAPSVWSLAALLLLAGSAYGPATVSAFEGLDVLAPGGGAEALTWVTTAEAAGAAAGSAAAGVLAAHHSTWLPFAASSALLVAAAAVAFGARRRS
jgi:MFS family permease